VCVEHVHFAQHLFDSGPPTFDLYLSILTVACGTVFGKGSNDPIKQSLVPYIFFIEKQ
jgi:hypothetical protein